jgi:hypothetical protein
MKKFRIIIWAGFLVIMIVFFLCDHFYLKPGIVSLEFANAMKGKSILGGWKNDKVLSVAQTMIWLDFAYIFFYVAIIITLSNRQIRKEPSIGLNALLRANFLFAFMAGFFDVVENISLLYNIRYWETSYFSAIWATWLKFILIGWTVLIWLISFIKSIVNR